MRGVLVSLFSVFVILNTSSSPMKQQLTVSAEHHLQTCSATLYFSIQFCHAAEKDSSQSSQCARLTHGRYLNVNNLPVKWGYSFVQKLQGKKADLNCIIYTDRNIWMPLQVLSPTVSLLCNLHVLYSTLLVISVSHSQLYLESLISWNKRNAWTFYSLVNMSPSQSKMEVKENATNFSV